MNPAPKCSVIIPCFNLGEYLDEAVDSVLSQTVQDFEIFIVNDGSTDPFTVNLLKDYVRPKTTVLSTPNQGLPTARNHGIRHSRGEYVCCLDADDKYDPRFLEACASVLDRDPDERIGFVTPGVHMFGPDFSSIWASSAYNPSRLVVENLMQSACMFRRKCWDLVGGYDLNLSGFQDWDFWLAIVESGYQWAPISDALIHYRHRPGSMISRSNQVRMSLQSKIHKKHESFIRRNLHDIMSEYDTKVLQLTAAEKDLQLTRMQLEEEMRTGAFWRTEHSKAASEVEQRGKAIQYFQEQNERREAQLSAFHRRFIRGRWQELKESSSVSRVALYGAGQFTRWLLEVLDNTTGPGIAAILDDNPEGKSVEGWNAGIFKPQTFDYSTVDAVVLSTDTHQVAMRQRLSQLGLDNSKIIDLYESLPTGPYPKS